jgi:hypothetical protein
MNWSDSAAEGKLYRDLRYNKKLDHGSTPINTDLFPLYSRINPCSSVEIRGGFALPLLWVVRASVDTRFLNEVAPGSRPHDSPAH